MISRKIITSIALVVAAIVAVGVSAQQIEQLDVDVANDFVIGPGKTEIVVEPGQSVEREVRITSRIPGETTFSLGVEDFTGTNDPDRTVELLGEEEGPYSLRDFVDLPFQEFTLGFGERITVPVTVTIPEDVDPGGRYGAIIVSNAPSKEVEGVQNTGAVVVSRLGSLFLVRVAGEVTESGQLTDFRMSPEGSVFFSEQPGQFEILYQNEGSVHLVPYGYIDIKNLFGATIDRIPVDAYFALPNSVRSRVVEWQEAPGLFGYYRAELSLNLGYDELTDERSLSFWVLPWQPILIGLLVIVVMSMLIVGLARRFEIKRK